MSTNTDGQIKTLIVEVASGDKNAIQNLTSLDMEETTFAFIHTDEVKTDLPSSVTPIKVDDHAAKVDERLLQSGFDMVFVISALGGTNPQIASSVAQMAKNSGALCIGIVTRPFDFEGRDKCARAEEELVIMEKCVDTLITIPSQNLYSGSSLTEGLKHSNLAIYHAVKSILYLKNSPNILEIDLIDLSAIMKDGGRGLFGFGQANGENALMKAAAEATNSPLLDGDLSSSKAVLISISAPIDTTLVEVIGAVHSIQDQVRTDVDLIFGLAGDKNTKSSSIAIFATKLAAK